MFFRIATFQTTKPRALELYLQLQGVEAATISNTVLAHCPRFAVLQATVTQIHSLFPDVVSGVWGGSAESFEQACLAVSSKVTE